MSARKEFSTPDDLTDLSAVERQHHLIEWLRCGRRLTSGLAAKTFGVSRRTIARDLTHLREALTLDISFDAAEGTYVLADEHSALPFLAFPSLAPVLLGARLERGLEGTGTDSSHHCITVRFSARAIRSYIGRGGRVPEGATNEDGTLDAHFALKNPDEFICYLLSRGHHVEVLHPPDFRQRIHMEIRRMLAIYDDDVDSNA
jgi:predicted DNA-binding transcriptional regulator YafY